ncbi:MAG: prolyl oligopeptidase family serine peptidase [Limisphaerales bacterium]
MRWLIRSTLLTAAVASLTGCAHTSSRLHYPVARATNQVDIYHGVAVRDPYRWMEDLDAPPTKEWVEAENKVTFAYLDGIPERAAIKRRLTQLWNYERYGVPFKEGGRYFFTKNDGLQNQAVLYTMTSLDGAPAVLLDPNKLSTDGTVALSGYAISEDGNFMAYGLATAGSDWQEWKVRDVRTGQDLPDLIHWVKFSGASWTKDGKGFFYSRYDEPTDATKLTKANYFQKLYYHRLGTPQAEDRLVYERPDQKEWMFDGSVSDDGRYLVITISQGTDRKNRVFYQDLTKAGAQVVELLNDFDAQYSFIDNHGPVFWFQTDLDAPRGRVIAIDTTAPKRPNWKELIPQSQDSLKGVGTVGGKFVASYLKDARSVVKLFALDGRPTGEVPLPGVGSAGGFSGKRNEWETFYSFTSFTVPGTIYRYDLRTGVSTVFRQPKVDFNPDDYVTRQVFYRSQDGARVPMFVTHRKDLKLNGRNPTYLYGYGGFDISLTPGFSVANVVWMEMGGVYAMANLRGGGEYGEAWHQAGMKLNKQNVFDDFIAAAEWLCGRETSGSGSRRNFVAGATKFGQFTSDQSVAKRVDSPQRFTGPAKLAIAGGSNGGLLVGACETQRPDLYGACLPAVGVMDMLRFQKFTIGWAWTSDYGSSDNAEDFKALYAYSPLHRIRPGVHYPPTLITTADHDDRVVPAHSFKFAATLQAAQAARAPVLIRIETRAGHGAGKPTTKLIDETADKFGFLVRELKMTLPAPFSAVAGTRARR